MTPEIKATISQVAESSADITDEERSDPIFREYYYVGTIGYDGSANPDREAVHYARANQVVRYMSGAINLQDALTVSDDSVSKLENINSSQIIQLSNLD